jgi:hypothetical protein
MPRQSPQDGGFVTRRGWLKDSRAVGSRRKTAAFSLKQIWRAAPCAIRILRSKSPSFLQKTVILSSRRSPVPSPVLKGLLHISGVSWLDPSLTCSSRHQRVAAPREPAHRRDGRPDTPGAPAKQSRRASSLVCGHSRARRRANERLELPSLSPLCEVALSV